MKVLHNGIVYSVNNNPKYIEMMSNSINSLFHFNLELLENTTVFILTDDVNIDLSLIDSRIKHEILKIPDDDYKYDISTICKRWIRQTFFRFELFRNEKLTCLDNVLYVDCDTEFNDSIMELFINHDKPTIYMVKEIGNNLRDRKKQPKYGDFTCDNYCNAGFIFLTPKMIGNDTLRGMWNMLDELSKTYKMRALDQDCINAVLGNKKYSHLLHLLPKTYNFTIYTAPRCSAVEFRRTTEYKMKHYCAGAVIDKRFLKGI